MKDYPLQWKIPSSDDLIFVRTLIQTFIKPEMAKLTKWSDGRLELSKSQIAKSLQIIACFQGFCECFPAFINGEAKCSPTKQPKIYMEKDIYAIEELFEGEPLRDQLLNLLHQVLEQLRVVMPDNVSLFVCIIKVRGVASEQLEKYALMYFFLFLLQNIRALIFPYDSAYYKASAFTIVYRGLKKSTAALPSVHSKRMRQYHLVSLSITDIFLSCIISLIVQPSWTDMLHETQTTKG